MILAFLLGLVLCLPGTDAGPEIQAALDGGGAVQLRGHCQVGATLRMRSLSSLRGPAVLRYDGPGEAILFEQTQHATVENLVLWSMAGNGIRFSNASHSYVDKVQINTPAGHGLILASGAGLFVTDTNANGTRGAGTRAVLINGTWDTATFQGFTSAEHDTGFRIGGSAGVIANLMLSNIILDRLGSVGLHVEPNGGAVYNVQVTGLWTAGSHGMLINALEGRVATVLVMNWRASESPNGVWVAGEILNLSVAHLVQTQ